MKPEIEVLMKSRLDGVVLKLPSYQLDRPLYSKVKKMLEGIGGKWNRKAQGFIFMHNPRPLLDRIVKQGATINLKQDFQFFETPAKIAKLMVKYAKIKPGELVLEPSAGRGAIIDHIPKDAKIFACEIMKPNLQILKSKDVNILCNDFMSLEERPMFDKIVANPPFSKDQDIDHIMKMYRILRNGGRLVSLSSPSWTFKSFKKSKFFRDFLNRVDAKLIYLPEKTFKESGTNIATIMIIIDKLDSYPNRNRDFNKWLRNQRSKNE
jgi:SAM-dependent methyltransferase